MKSKIIIIALLLIEGLCSVRVNAQSGLLADQNPRYMESQAKYTAMADTLTALQGTTVQKTYKAFDWYQDKLERRQQRREWRHQEVMSGAYSYPSWGLYSGYSSPYGNFGYGYGLGSQWGRNGFWGPRASIGFGYNW
ncbi:hypothetical protein [Mucilaginibacter antarcticus]|uniref:Uncharacterized protein n=1 Tax=Mucilaginibacter antarcticus TaxID=1855725 RepID=A0ABW5XS94_9SPHI